MSARLLILVVLAGGLAVFIALRPKKATVQTTDEDIAIMAPEGKTEADIVKPHVSEQAISGKEPAEKADLRVAVEVDKSGGKNRLAFTISEAHGWYADAFDIIAWRKGPDVEGPEDSAFAFPTHVNNYLPAKGTLRMCVHLVPLELSKMGGDIGKSEDWEAEVVNYGRAREQNPDPLPKVSATSGCD